MNANTSAVVHDMEQGHDLPSNETSFSSVMIDAVKADRQIDGANAVRGTVSGELMDCAKQFVEDSGTFNIGTSPTARGELKGEPVGFLGKCYEAEQFIKDPQRAGKYYQSSIPKSWTQAKSNIVKAYMDFGLVVTDYTNDDGECVEGKLREALNEARKAAKNDEASSVALQEIKVADLRAIGEEAPALSFTDLINAIVAQYRGLPEDGEQREKMLSDLVKVHQKYRKVLEAIVPVTPQAPSEQAEVVNH